MTGSDSIYPVSIFSTWKTGYSWWQRVVNESANIAFIVLKTKWMAPQFDKFGPELPCRVVAETEDW